MYVTGWPGGVASRGHLVGSSGRLRSSGSRLRFDHPCGETSATRHGPRASDPGSGARRYFDFFFVFVFVFVAFPRSCTAIPTTPSTSHAAKAASLWGAALSG